MEKVYGSIEDVEVEEPEPRFNFNNFMNILKVLILVVCGSAILIAVIVVPLKSKKTNTVIPTLAETRSKGVFDPVKDKDWLSLLNPYNMKVKPNLLEEKIIRAKLMSEFDGENIRKHLRVITRKLHVAGTKENLEVADYIAQQYKSYGLETKVTDYDVFLGYPDYQNSNKIYIKSNGSWDLVSNGMGTPLGPPEAQKQQSDPRARIWWNAYSADGTAVGRLVYANHGTVEDYKFLDQQNISLQGAIALVRYGELWRGAKTYEAEKRGAIGVIVFSDPEDYGPPEDMPANFTFPNSIYLPPEGAQRGTMTLFDGDLLTPFYPAKPYVYRSTNEETLREQLTIPKVPVMPIGYGAAKKLLESMHGPIAPEKFQGGIRGLQYRLTGDNSYKLEVHATTNDRSPIKNVCGYVKGSEEPDKVIILCNHFDAWVFGGFDPNSGTAATLEIGRVLMKVVNDTNWKPRRTIMLCNWDAEEHGLIGSTEWLEENFKMLSAHAVAVINVDTAASGNVSLNAAAVPLMYQPLISAAKHVPNPNPNELIHGRLTMFDSWIHYYPNKENPNYPKFDLPGAGSDHYQFLALAGIPVGSLGYKSCPPKGCSNLYHSMYATAWTVENLVDPKFKAHVGMSRLSLEYARLLADSLIIPFNVTDYGLFIKDSVEALDSYLRKNEVASRLANYDEVITNLRDASSRFLASCFQFQNKVEGANLGEVELSLRQKEMLNTRLTELERCFINPRGLYPGRDNARHLVFASSKHNNYAGEVFSGIRDCVENYQESQGDEATKWLKEIRQGISSVQYAIESGILVLDIKSF